MKYIVLESGVIWAYSASVMTSKDINSAIFVSISEIAVFFAVLTAFTEVVCWLCTALTAVFLALLHWL